MASPSVAIALAAGGPVDIKPLIGRPGYRLKLGRYRVICRRQGGKVGVLDVAARGSASWEGDMEPQLIHDSEGKPVFAILPIEEYERLLRAAEDLNDLAVHEAVKDEETVPAELVYRIMDGENRVRCGANTGG